MIWTKLEEIQHIGATDDYIKEHKLALNPVK